MIKIPVIYSTQTGKSSAVADIISKRINNNLNNTYNDNNINKDNNINNLNNTYNDNNIYNKYTNNGIVSFSVDIEDIDIINIFKYKYVLFVCSTAGDGDIPYSMNKLWKLLCYRYRNKSDNKNMNNNSNNDNKCNVSNSKNNNVNNYQHNNNKPVNNNNNLFVNLHYALFGLGDSSFSKYNYASKKLYNILKRLDVNMILERGEGDDQDRNGYKDGLDPWIEELTNNLKKLITEEKYIDSSDREECNSIDSSDRDEYNSIDNSDKKEGRDECNNIDKKNMIKNKYNDTNKKKKY